jgi:ribonucleoside-diphosphate reductase alpha chain
MSRFSAAIAEQIWDMKYRMRAQDGTAIDGTVEDTWRRIARALAEVEAEPSVWEDRFYAALEGFRFLPAGRITAGAGTGRSVTLFNCFVMGTIPDSMGGIFDGLKEAALTMQQGGGIGYDFSTIRPRGAEVKGVAADASGPLSFMDVWDAMCRTIMSAGSRRGAMMATMRCDHPDIEAFIRAKKDPARLRMFNLSVLVTDAFMAAVKADGPWDLVFQGRVYRTVQARDLWAQIMRNTYDFAEPGVIFIDRINAANNLNYVETIAATNPCGEQPLPPYGACLLGSINLAKLVWYPFEDRAHVCKTALAELVRVAVRMMDNVVDASRFPLPEQAAEALAKRRIGLGVTGLADALLMCGLRYGSDAAVAATEDWMHAIAREAYLASVDLAKEKGAFPLFDAEGFLASGNMQGMDADVREAVRAHGIRNALLTSVAPTGTISLYAGNVSSGIEPVFAYAYTRKVLQKDGSRTEEEVVDYAVRLWREMHGDKELPDYFVNAQTLPPLDHVRMQAAAQKWVDSSISKTINCPEDISFEDFQQVYMAAWDQGCKGCTTYRPNAVTGSVLTVSEAKPAPVTQGEVVYLSEPLDRRARRADLQGEMAGVGTCAVYYHQ